jgi:hypothetical protein
MRSHTRAWKDRTAGAPGKPSGFFGGATLQGFANKCISMVVVLEPVRAAKRHISDDISGHSGRVKVEPVPLWQPSGHQRPSSTRCRAPTSPVRHAGGKLQKQKGHAFGALCTTSGAFQHRRAKLFVSLFGFQGLVQARAASAAAFIGAVLRYHFRGKSRACHPSSQRAGYCDRHNDTHENPSLGLSSFLNRPSVRPQQHGY